MLAEPTFKECLPIETEPGDVFSSIPVADESTIATVAENGPPPSTRGTSAPTAVDWMFIDCHTRIGPFPLKETAYDVPSVIGGLQRMAKDLSEKSARLEENSSRLNEANRRIQSLEDRLGWSSDVAELRAQQLGRCRFTLYAVKELERRAAPTHPPVEASALVAITKDVRSTKESATHILSTLETLASASARHVEENLTLLGALADRLRNQQVVIESLNERDLKRAELLRSFREGDLLRVMEKQKGEHAMAIGVLETKAAEAQKAFTQLEEKYAAQTKSFAKLKDEWSWERSSRIDAVRSNDKLKELNEKLRNGLETRVPPQFSFPCLFWLLWVIGFDWSGCSSIVTILCFCTVFFGILFPLSPI